MATDSQRSIRNLAGTIHSLLGVKAHVTSTWVKSVCDIIKNLPSEASSKRSIPADSERTLSHNHGVDQDPDVLKIRDELAALTSHINQLNIQRREVLNEFLDLKGNIRVFCRIRPMGMMENFGRSRPVLDSDSNKIILKLADNKSKSYSFDKVFHPGSSQEEVFSEVEPVIKSVLDGYNACIFAYGQTGTGKTFTMEGTPDSRGVVHRTIEALFEQAADSNHAFVISFSMVEIYLGNLKDLLVSQPIKPTDPMPPCLSIRTDPKRGVEIDNLVSIQANDFNQALRLYRLGCRYRSTASTYSNITSSRSHCMIRLSITCFDAPERQRETNKIWLVDLGGSERVLKTKASGRRLDEGKAINMSLSALGSVINALQRKKGHVPYRNTKLTQVLKDSLAEDSKTLMLVHVSPKEEDLCETVCSLNFATRAKSIHLGNDDSVEVREQKQVALVNLQQRMKEIEDERLCTRRDIKKLNDKLENLSKPALCSEGLQTSYLSMKEAQLNSKVTINNIGAAATAPSSGMPRFMRPTVSSRRKNGLHHQTSEGRDQFSTKRRKPPSHRAKSVNFPVKNNSGYNSEHSISRNSCFDGLNIKSIADNETEYSQDTFECDVKIGFFQEQEKAQQTSCQRAQCREIEKHGNGNTEKLSSTKFSKVDIWLRLHKNEPPINGDTHRSKRVLAFTLPEKKLTCYERSKAVILQDEKRHGLTRKRIPNPVKSGKLLDVRETERSISEVVIDKPPKMLKDLFDEELRSDSINLLHNPDGQTMIRKEDLVGDSSMSEVLESCCQETPSDLDGEDHESKDLTAPFLCLRKGVRLQRALFMDSPKQNDISLRQNTGMYTILKQKIQIICASALLGLGFYDLGFQHDFFNSLML
ncbi:kinesin-like protein KIF3A-like isoform X1 [Tripterygium wilfordii]|uniref:Kinesin-like protein KIF3A-like isoform X1 n=1 Tax=Tripterygium wilfordii TaxID=458696 RepID=A0A7J7BUM6_TRIWF|nr:kinesin-like protein KIN-14T [Tripterygium wilfordii]XP_038695897.1 kinesin-like protein KIN-14T [Tripterygium wilfordii]XP_038695898.1 kinesin-like protein KIN-14T [Tripterygium wilfordii]XP_038695900.1 kinesin-like protein KIN-14T [Tripterygium wilfordii]KAF5725538.1 kinesin-like protein KIF3A-like isoform X1 [Tripterygium wilfordii]